LDTRLGWRARGNLGKYGKQWLGAAVKRKAKDRMGRACVEVDEENGRTLQEATRLAKGRKAMQIWLMHTDA
jgi:GMP synthase-like glutamine amidotransferase